MLNAVLDVAAGWPAPAVLAVACVLLVVESGSLVGMAVPGTTLLVALGLWSLTAPQLLVPSIAAAAAATVTGAHLGWRRGRAGVPAGRARGRVGRIADARAAQAARWLAARGRPAAALLLACGHWAAAARPVLPRVAGAAGVPYRVAGPVLIISGAAWATALVLLGNRVGALVLTSAAWVPIVLVVLLIAVLGLGARFRRSPRPGAEAEPPRPPPLRRRKRSAGGSHREPNAAAEDRASTCGADQPLGRRPEPAHRPVSPVRAPALTLAEPGRCSEWS